MIYVIIFTRSIDCRYTLESSLLSKNRESTLNYRVRGFEMACTIPGVVRRLEPHGIEKELTNIAIHIDGR